jgi:hypothetical protein
MTRGRYFFAETPTGTRTHVLTWTGQGWVPLCGCRGRFYPASYRLPLCTNCNPGLAVVVRRMATSSKW